MHLKMPSGKWRPFCLGLNVIMWSRGRAYKLSLEMQYQFCHMKPLTHWGRVTHICIGNLTIIGSDNGLSPGRRQAIIWTNAEILLIGPLGTNFSEIQIGIQAFSDKKMHLNMLSAKWRPFCLGLNVLILGVGWDLSGHQVMWSTIVGLNHWYPKRLQICSQHSDDPSSGPT